MFQEFTDFEYLLIDLANCYGHGLDKRPYSERIDWADNMLVNTADPLSLLDEAKDSALFAKAVLAIQDVRKGQQTGHLIGFDATASGIQIMGALTGCRNTALMTNLIDPYHVYDVYTGICECINQNLPAEKHIHIGAKTDHSEETHYLTRDDVKYCVMPYFYGSEAIPRKVFGFDIDVYQQFYQVMYGVLTGPSQLRDVLIKAWRPNNTRYSWLMPDGFCVDYPHRIKIGQYVEDERAFFRIPQLSVVFFHRHERTDKERKRPTLAANVIHSIDGYIPRELQRYASFSREMLRYALRRLPKDLPAATYNPRQRLEHPVSLAHARHIANSAKYLKFLSEPQLAILKQLIETALSYPTHRLLTIHDEFRAPAYAMNQVRRRYNEQLLALHQSDIVRSIHNNITGRYPRIKQQEDLSKYILNANYAIM